MTYNYHPEYTLIDAKSPNVLNLGDRVRCPSGGYARIAALEQSNGYEVELFDGVSSWLIRAERVVRAAA